VELLNLVSLQMIDASLVGARYRVRARARRRTPVCVHCSSGRLYTHGAQTQSYADTPVDGRAVTICVDRQRYRCRSCGRTFFEPIEDLDGKRRATRRLIDYVERQSLTQPFLRIARDVGLDDKTIRSIFNDYTSRMAGEVHAGTPRFLGIEPAAGEGACGDFIMDVEKGTLFDILPGRDVDALIDWFRNLPGADRIAWVATGPDPVYPAVIRAALPGARLVIDRCHALELADDALDAARRTLRRTLPKSERARLRGDRRILLSPASALPAADAERLALWLGRYPLLRAAYAMKETFRDIWMTSTSSGAALLAWQEWRRTVQGRAGRYFADLVRTLDSRSADFMAWFDCPMPENYTESARATLDAIVKSMARMGHGYSFEVTRAKMLLGSAPRTTTPDQEAVAPERPAPAAPVSPTLAPATVAACAAFRLPPRPPMHASLHERTRWPDRSDPVPAK
jgi:transposase